MKRILGVLFTTGCWTGPYEEHVETVLHEASTEVTGDGWTALFVMGGATLVADDEVQEWMEVREHGEAAFSVTGTGGDPLDVEVIWYPSLVVTTPPREAGEATLAGGETFELVREVPYVGDGTVATAASTCQGSRPILAWRLASVDFLAEVAVELTFRVEYPRRHYDVQPNGYVQAVCGPTADELGWVFP